MNIIRSLGWIIIFLFSTVISQELDSRYHTLEEIYEAIYAIDEDSNTDYFFRIDTIGFSTLENIPILAVKISNNVNVREDEARVLFIGQVHAEEVIGVESVLQLIDDLVNPEPIQQNHVNILRANLEIWIIPTANPEGLNVVHEGLDVSYRKNKRDLSPEGPFPNGVFDFDPSVGNDLDGVDINRNFSFNWTFGDTFLEPDASDYASHYDYYKGEEPFSEGESIAIRDLALREQFLFSIVWHSSRSGRLSEKVFTSWLWEESKPSPDLTYMKTIADDFAEGIETEDGSGTYLSVYSGSRNGKLHDWFYRETGCIQYLIECGTAILQPDSTLLENTIERINPAMWYLMDRSIGYYMDASQLTGIVTDASTDAPIQGAIVEVLEHSGSVLKPRKTDEFGRYRRILDVGSYTVSIRAKGYEPQIISVVVNNAAITNQNVSLNLAQNYTLNVSTIIHDLLTVESTGYLFTEFGIDTLIIGGTNIIELPEDDYHLTLIRMGTMMPWEKSFHLNRDMSFIADFQEANPVALGESWPWENAQGPWIVGNVILKTQEDSYYENGDTAFTEQWMESELVDMSGKNRLVLKVDHRFETEWDYDPVSISMIDQNDSLLVSKSWTGLAWGDYQTDYMTAINESGFDSVKIRLSFLPDETVNYHGWELQELTLFSVNDEYLSVAASQGGYMPKIPLTLNRIFPNPSQGMFQLDIGHWPGGKGGIVVYNLLGQEIAQYPINQLSPGRHFIRLNLEQSMNKLLSSGVYFIVLNTEREMVTQKCVFMKN
ncbi:MAG: T9SS type A sorting domain-containing protein [Candidatus Marinimicrobia bacterium]|jgi:hypothetical protein|nr:T9SS type A sorting domain-containing protein [Candidatus Neomarinimicrobiota bacterium]MBT3960671.1 T9SS type A sorting domain-containing protein [Candidatus Neomarinimicrobiota bacterium]MBT4382861.1 T9SS type A sorting domain-containing protein [Candidatus Neomarinimicrobiota bacterium]MBT4635061.1 T9SS type A sorting domain-containing protein [Candidatus Neomarinimicrobiota bacterium]MBT4686358.1 T9SS type A sorting domain-containing protein [Candidatus Neomarinimicrobiota bacterium]